MACQKVPVTATEPVIVVEVKDTTHGEVDWVTATVPLMARVPLTGWVTPEPSTRSAPAVVRDRGLVFAVVYVGAAVVTAPCIKMPSCPEVVEPWATEASSCVTHGDVDWVTATVPVIVVLVRETTQGDVD